MSISDYYHDQINDPDNLAELDNQEPPTRFYTVWVGGTEVNDNYVHYGEALRLYDEYKEKGHTDVMIKEMENKNE